MATYRPATVDDSAVLARMARDRRRAAEAASRPGKTQAWQTTDKVAGLLDHGSYEAGLNIDITDMTISAPELGAGDVDELCTLD